MNIGSLSNMRKKSYKDLSLLGIVNFYRDLVRKGVIEKGSSGYNRMRQLEDRMEQRKYPVVGRRIKI